MNALRKAVGIGDFQYGYSDCNIKIDEMSYDEKVDLFHQLKTISSCQNTALFQGYSSNLVQINGYSKRMGHYSFSLKLYIATDLELKSKHVFQYNGTSKYVRCKIQLGNRPDPLIDKLREIEEISIGERWKIVEHNR